jgi:hypothetical protein
LTFAARPAILCQIAIANDDEQEEYAVSTPPREPAARCEAGASVDAEWAWELRNEPKAKGKRQKAKVRSGI